MQLLRKGMLVARCFDRRSKKRYVGHVMLVNKRKNTVWVDWGNCWSISRCYGFHKYGSVVTWRLTYLRCKVIGFWHYKMIK